MFDALDTTFLDPKKYSVLGLYQSLNQPQISPQPNVAAEPATCHFILVEAPNDSIQLFVGLHFFSSKYRVLYSTRAFLPEEMPEKIALAEAFAGEMGFMMDDLHYASAGDADRTEMLRTLVFFYRDSQTYLQALSTDEKQVKQSQAQTSVTKETRAEQYSYFLEQYVTILSML